MSIVAVSQTLGSLGDEIGREVARALAYDFADREIILRAAERFGEGTTELVHITEERPTLWERLADTQRHYRAYVEAIIWEMAVRDNVVLSGRGAPSVLSGIRHVLRIRITASERLRAKRLEDQQGLMPEAAIHLVRQSDRERASRVKFLYHVDWDDPALYDLVLNTDRLDATHAAQVAPEALESGRFEPTAESRAEVKDRSVTAQAQAALLVNPVTRPLQLQAHCTGAALRLTGVVRHDDQRRVAHEVVAGLPGVTEVRNDIVVAPQLRTGV